MTLLIKNVRISGSENHYEDYVDVFVNNGKISAIGNFPNKNADEVVDGLGSYLCAGFIDVDTDSDHYLSLLNYPAQEDFLRQGVTTIFGGMCGSSLAPLIYGSLESIQKWGDIRRVNVNWHTVAEFLKIMDKRPLSVNFGTLVGHATIRRAIVGDALRSLTKNEIAVFSETLKRALKEGAFGMSTGLGYVHGRGTPYEEIRKFAEVVREYDGVYATHLRQMDKEITAAVDETIKLVAETGVRTLISHFIPLRGAEHKYEAALEKLEKLPPDYNLNFDIYPFDTSVLALYTFLPNWAQNGGEAIMRKNVNDEWLQPRIEKDFTEINPEEFVVAQAPGHPYLVGKSLRDLMEIFNLRDFRKTLLKLMAATDLKGIIFYKNINLKLARRAIASSKSFIASNAASLREIVGEKILKPERATSTFTKFLNLVINQKLMPLDEAIAKITKEPALKFGLEGRGMLKEGAYADLACFSIKGGKIEIRCTVVNGRVVWQDGKFKEIYPGKILRHKA